MQRAHEDGGILLDVEAAGCGIPAHDRGPCMSSYERLRLVRTNVSEREYLALPAYEHHFPAPRAGDRGNALLEILDRRDVDSGHSYAVAKAGSRSGSGHRSTSHAFS